MNQVILVGRLTKDCELRFTSGANAKAVANFTIAVDRPFSKEKTADFFRVTVWGKPAENCANYTSKGSLVAIQGRLQNNNYEKDGVKHYSTEVVASRVEFLSRGKNQNEGQQGEYDGFQAIEEDDDDSIPF